MTTVLIEREAQSRSMAPQSRAIWLVCPSRTQRLWRATLRRITAVQWAASRLVLTALLGYPSAVTAAETPLRWSQPPGTILTVQLTQTTRTETTVKGTVSSVLIESGFDIQWTIERVDGDGTIRLTQAFTRLWLKTVSPDGKPSVYDSASSEEPAGDAKAIADAVRTLLRVRIGMNLSPRGEILEVQRPAEMDSLLGDQPARAGWKALLTKEGMSRTMQQALGTLPEGPVKAGDQWTVTRDLKTPLGNIQATDTYTYEGSSRDNQRRLDTIRVATDMKPAAALAANGAASKLPRQQTEGVFWFDTAAGFLAQSRLTQTLLTEVPYAGGNIQVKTVSTLETRLARTKGQELSTKPANSDIFKPESRGRDA